MADEQGYTRHTDTIPPGNYARQVTGDATKNEFAAISSLLVNVGVDGRRFPSRNSPPSNPELGDVYLADGVDWDPDGDASGAPELVIYDGSAWNEIIGL